MKLRMKIGRQLERFFVAIDLDHIASAVQNGAAFCAAGEVLIHREFQLRIEVAVDIVRNFPPNIFTFQDHGFVPLGKAEGLAQAPSRPGARKSRNIRRARSRRVFTAPGEIPRTSAASSVLKCCTSRNTKTSRYFSVNEAKALTSISRTCLRSSASEGISRQSVKSRGV